MTRPLHDPLDTVGTALALTALAADNRESDFGQLLALIPRSEWPNLVRTLAGTSVGYVELLATREGVDPAEAALMIRNVRSALMLRGYRPTTTTEENQA